MTHTRSQSEARGQLDFPSNRFRWGAALWVVGVLRYFVAQGSSDHGGVAISPLSLAIRRTAKELAAGGIALACVGLLGSVLSLAGRYAGHGVYLGLGVGGTGRLVAYPGNLWMLLVGFVVQLFPHAARRVAPGQ